MKLCQWRKESLWQRSKQSPRSGGKSSQLQVFGGSGRLRKLGNKFQKWEILRKEGGDRNIITNELVFKAWIHVNETGFHSRCWITRKHTWNQFLEDLRAEFTVTVHMLPGAVQPGWEAQPLDPKSLGSHPSSATYYLNNLKFISLSKLQFPHPENRDNNIISLAVKISRG